MSNIRTDTHPDESCLDVKDPVLTDWLTGSWLLSNALSPCSGIDTVRTQGLLGGGETRMWPLRPTGGVLVRGVGQREGGGEGGESPHVPGPGLRPGAGDQPAKPTRSQPGLASERR